MLLILFKFFLHNISHVIIMILLRMMPHILNLFLHVILLLMVLTWPSIQYPINITSILGIRETNFIIPPSETEFIGKRRSMR